MAKGVNPGLQDEVVSLVLPDEKFTIFASLGIQKNSEFANTFDFGLMKQAETGAQRKVIYHTVFIRLGEVALTHTRRRRRDHTT